MFCVWHLFPRWNYPISMMEKWRALVRVRVYHWFGERGGFISHFILSKIVARELNLFVYIQLLLCDFPFDRPSACCWLKYRWLYVIKLWNPHISNLPITRSKSRSPPQSKAVISRNLTGNTVKYDSSANCRQWCSSIFTKYFDLYV